MKNQTMRRLIALSLLLAFCIFSGCTAIDFSSFERDDVAMGVLATSITIVDWRQTQMFRNDGVYENNPLLGKKPSRNKVDVMISLGIVSQWLVSAMLPKEWRRSWNVGFIAGESVAVYNNYKNGYSPEW